MLDTSLDSLDIRFKPLAQELLLKCATAGTPLRVINTLRTKEQQAQFIKAGTSWTIHSRHLLGQAIDVCPVELLTTKYWSPNSTLWTKIGLIGEELGML